MAKSLIIPNLPQIVSGRLRQAMSVLLHSIGPVVGFASLLRGSRRSTGVVGRVRMLCGVQNSDQNHSSKLWRKHGLRRL